MSIQRVSEQIAQGSQHLGSSQEHVTHLAVNLLSMEDKLRAAITSVETAVQQLGGVQEDIDRVTASSQKAHREMRQGAGLFSEAALQEGEDPRVTRMIRGMERQAAGFQTIEMGRDRKKEGVEQVIGRLSFIANTLRDSMLEVTTANRKALTTNLEQTAVSYSGIIEEWLSRVRG